MKAAICLTILLLGFVSFLGCSEKTKDNHGSNMKDMMKINGKDILSSETVICPVTGGETSPAKAYAKTVYKGKIYYFCCAGCPEEFEKNPEKYAK